MEIGDKVEIVTYSPPKEGIVLSIFDAPTKLMKVKPSFVRGDTVEMVEVETSEGVLNVYKNYVNVLKN